MTSYGEAPPMFSPEGESNNEGQEPKLANKLQELQDARSYMEKEEYEKAKKDIIANFVGGVSVEILHPPTQHQQRQYGSQKIVQFRVSDTTCSDHLDDHLYWLRKDG